MDGKGSSPDKVMQHKVTRFYASARDFFRKSALVDKTACEQ